MNAYIVTQPLPTRSRRLPVGREVTAADLDTDIPAERWRELGYLEPKPQPKAATKGAAEPKPEPPAAD